MNIDLRNIIDKYIGKPKTENIINSVKNEISLYIEDLINNNYILDTKYNISLTGGKDNINVSITPYPSISTYKEKYIFIGTNNLEYGLINGEIYDIELYKNNNLPKRIYFQNGDTLPSSQSGELGEKLLIKLLEKYFVSLAQFRNQRINDILKD